MRGLSQELSRYPKALLTALAHVESHTGQALYVVGGTVRDWLLNTTPGDLDLTVARGAISCCHLLIDTLKGGTYVPLGTESEEAGRVVWRGIGIDFSSFRQGAVSIEGDLAKRDFSVNAIGVTLSSLMQSQGTVELIDPQGGVQDLQDGLLRACPNGFYDDPLRILRGYRLRALLQFAFEPATRVMVRSYKTHLGRVAAERIRYELDLIMASPHGAAVFTEMAESDVLWEILPELRQGVGVDQPAFHHLDVFHHCLAALGHMEAIVDAPASFFTEGGSLVHDAIQTYLQQPEKAALLKWAALFHDLGKPKTKGKKKKSDGRTTFYEHDRVGCQMFLDIARRLKWSNDNRQLVGLLIECHMHPFHLCTSFHDTPLTKRAGLGICKRTGDELAGLFLLAMADSLAGQGEKKPATMEQQLVQLFAEVLTIYERDIRPVVSGPKLVTGHDLITTFQLTPGPLFSKILGGLELARVEGEVHDRRQALDWVADYLRSELGSDN